MKVAIWKTGHEIADTVAAAFYASVDNRFNSLVPHCGFGGDPLHYTDINIALVNDVHIAYGILRASGKLFKDCENLGKAWFEIDRGYFSPGHFDGYYRISYKGTQCQFNELRKSWHGELKPFRFSGRSVMIVPPTQHVADFFSIDLMAWIDWASNEALSNGYSCFVRTKGDTIFLDDQLKECKAVITFNSSIGWKALQMGIPVLSDATHSTVGSHYRIDSLQKLMSFLPNMPDTRLELFECMQAHQFTLEEIKQGKAWPLISKYSSDGIPERESAPMSAPIPSRLALKHRFQSNTSNTAS